MDLQRLEELYKKATPGPWSFDMDGESGYGNYHGDENIDEWQRLFYTDELGAFKFSDIKFISELYVAFPEILKRLRAADVAMAAVKNMDGGRTSFEVQTGIWVTQSGNCWEQERDAIIADYEKAII